MKKDPKIVMTVNLDVSSSSEKLKWYAYYLKIVIKPEETDGKR